MIDLSSDFFHVKMSQTLRRKEPKPASRYYFGIISFAGVHRERKLNRTLPEAFKAARNKTPRATVQSGVESLDQLLLTTTMESKKQSHHRQTTFDIGRGEIWFF